MYVMWNSAEKGQILKKLSRDQGHRTLKLYSPLSSFVTHYFLRSQIFLLEWTEGFFCLCCDESLMKKLPIFLHFQSTLDYIRQLFRSKEFSLLNIFTPEFIRNTLFFAESNLSSWMDRGFLLFVLWWIFNEKVARLTHLFP